MKDISELLHAVLCSTVVHNAYAHKYEQLLNLCLVRVRLVLCGFKRFSLYVCVFLC